MQFNPNNQNRNYNANSNNDFPTLGGQPQGQQNQYQGYQQTESPFGANPPATEAAPAEEANPFANSDPFGAASSSNPFDIGSVKDFKPKVQGAIDLGDDAGFGGFQEVGNKKKLNQEAKIAALKKKKEEEEAKKSTKGKPSSFFIMNYIEGDDQDPTGQHRVPTEEQQKFIYAHYPTEWQPQQMIYKIYMLYQDAVNEEMKEQEAQIYNQKPQRDSREMEEVIDTSSGSGFGGGGFGAGSGAAATKKTRKQRDQKEADQAKAKVQKAAKVKDQDVEAQKKQAALAIKVKDIDVQPSDDCIEVDPNRDPASLVFIGHVDAGKSTICGQIVYQMGIVDERTIQQLKEEAKKKGRDSWWLAFIMDNNEEEMEKGKTVDIGRTCFDTPHKNWTIFDAPGHKNYVPNMIQGVAQADFAGLVISARKGEFEAGFEKEGQTREHIQLVQSLGVKKLVIVVNKMDESTVKWSKDRWDEIRNGLLPFLYKTGYKDEDLFWVPISGLRGDNITEKSDACKWYDGPCLMDIFDNLPVLERDANAPIRFPILDKVKEQSKVSVIGKVEQGTLRLGDKLAISPQNLPCQVLDIENFKNEKLPYARPGDTVKVRVSYLTEDQVNKGDCLCPRDNPMHSTQVILAELELLELRIPVFSKGSSFTIHIHTYSDLIVIQKIEWALEKDRDSGIEVRKENPALTKSHAKCLVRIASRNQIPIEKLEDVEALGRFTLRDEGKTIALGRVMKFVPFNKEHIKKVATPGAAGAAGATKVNEGKNMVFNAETGQLEEVKPALGSIAEE